MIQSDNRHTCNWHPAMWMPH